MYYDLDTLQELSGELGFSCSRPSPDELEVLIESNVPLVFQNLRREEDTLIGFRGTGWHSHGRLMLMRDELMVRMRAESVVGPTVLGDDIQRRLALHQQKLALYRDIEARDFSDGNTSRKAQLQHLVLSAGIMQETMWVEFAEKALAILATPEH